MPLRTRLAHTVVALVIVFSALVAVGITAPESGPFAIVIRPSFVSLGIDIDVKLGSMHFHYAWSAIPDGLSSTKSSRAPF